MLIIIIVGIIAICFWLRVKRKRKLSIYLADHYMQIDKPIPICGTPDVIWLRGDGALVVGDYKSRSNGQTYYSDIIQLSTYKVLLKYTQGRSIADYGYIHFSKGRRVAVKLLSEREVIELYRHYCDVVKGTVNSRSVNRKEYCRFCPHIGKC